VSGQMRASLNVLGRHPSTTTMCSQRRRLTGRRPTSRRTLSQLKTCDRRMLELWSRRQRVRRCRPVCRITDTETWTPSGPSPTRRVVMCGASTSQPWTRRTSCCRLLSHPAWTRRRARVSHDTIFKKVKLARTRLPSVVFRS